MLVVAKPSPEVLVSLVNVVFWLLQRDTTVYVEPSIFHRMTEVTACLLILLCSGLLPVAVSAITGQKCWLLQLLRSTQLVFCNLKETGFNFLPQDSRADHL